MKTLAFSLLLAVVPVYAQTATPTTDISNSFIKNFHKVDETLYRGGQPDPDNLDAAMTYLKSLGIQRVIDLRGVDDIERREEAAAKKAGLEFKSYPMRGLGAPQLDEVLAIEKDIQCANCSPVFIHCHKGADRTGTISAIYRIDHGWTDADAIAEMRHYGDSIYEFAMRRFVRDYYRTKAAAPQSTASLSKN